MSLVAERYALALFQISKKNDSQNSVGGFLKELAKAIEEHIDIKKLFYSPMISNSDKLAVLKTSVGGDLPQDLQGFFQVLSRNNRLGALPGIARAFTELLNQESGSLNGSVVSAVELSESEKKSLKETIEKELNKSVSLEFNVDPNVIGGVEAKVGSYVFEDSVQSHMQQLNDFITRRVQ